MGGLEPSSNQAGSGEQFKRGEKYISPGGTNVPKTVLFRTGQRDIWVVVAESFRSARIWRFSERQFQRVAQLKRTCPVAIPVEGDRVSVISTHPSAAPSRGDGPLCDRC